MNCGHVNVSMKTSKARLVTERRKKWWTLFSLSASVLEHNNTWGLSSMYWCIGCIYNINYVLRFTLFQDNWVSMRNVYWQVCVHYFELPTVGIELGVLFVYTTAEWYCCFFALRCDIDGAKRLYFHLNLDIPNDRVCTKKAAVSFLNQSMWLIIHLFHKSNINSIDSGH